jgi:Pyruvate/2-oxoacid:ferredoxin oxidoreductase delta subunit
MPSSPASGLSRRDLFGLFRRRAAPAQKPVPTPVPAAPAVAKPEPAPAAPAVAEPAPAPAGFSLEAFYAAREQSGERTGTSLPLFSLREGLVVPQDGVSRIGMAPSAEGLGAAVHAVERSAAAGAGMAVRVRPRLCLAWQGSFCSTCSERCPEEGAIAVEQGRPRVVEERCNGCGVCVQVCPAPLNAFEFLPSRPEAPPP